MMANLTDLLGPVDILINNAGVIRVGSFSEMEIEDFDEALEVIFWGALHTTLALLPAMRASGQGSVVNITSTEVK
jgi:NADP-dependent 3-hydroxy acid dehydrogenase YdfG